MPNLNLKVPSKLLCQAPENSDEVLAAICKYQNHPSIKTILEKCNFSFSFKTVSLTDIEKEMKSLNANKASIYKAYTNNNFETKHRFLFFCYIRLRK